MQNINRVQAVLQCVEDGRTKEKTVDERLSTVSLLNNGSIMIF